MLDQLRNIVVLILVLYGVGYFVVRGGNFTTKPALNRQLLYDDESTPLFLSRCGPPSADRKAISFTMVSGTDKQVWLDALATKFGHLCPNIQVQLVYLNSLEAAQALAAGKLRPTLWTPTSDLAMRYYQSLASKTKQPPLFDFKKRISLLASPLVWLTTDNRQRVLQQIFDARRHDEGQWMTMGCAMVPRTVAALEKAELRPGTWLDLYRSAQPEPAPAPAEPPPKASKRKRGAEPPPPAPAPPPPDPLLGALNSWGRVRFGHPNPARSLAGLEVLSLLSFDFTFPPGALAAAPRPAEAAKATLAFNDAFKAQQAAFADWLHRCEGDVPNFANSAAEIADDFVRLGAQNHDVVAVYEQSAIPILDHIQKRPEQLELLRIMYPQPTLWSNQPIVALDTAAPDQKEKQLAASKWIAYLLSNEAQQAAIELGFRPGRSDLSVRDYKSPENPFLRLTSRGVQAELPRNEPPPLDGATLVELMRIWGRATGRY